MMKTVFPAVISSKLSGVSSIALAVPSMRAARARMEDFMVKDIHNEFMLFVVSLKAMPRRIRAGILVCEKVMTTRRAERRPTATEHGMDGRGPLVCWFGERLNILLEMINIIYSYFQ